MRGMCYQLIVEWMDQVDWNGFFEFVVGSVVVLDFIFIVVVLSVGNVVVEEFFLQVGLLL